MARVFRGRPQLALVVLGLVAFTLSAGLAWGPLEGIPHVTDEVVYDLQARLLATGRILVESPVAPSFQEFPFVRVEPGLHGAFPPGWPLLLSLGVIVGLPWLVNPLLAGLLPALTWQLSRRVSGDERVGWLAAFIAAFSPGIMVLAASRMSQTSLLVAFLGLAILVFSPPGPRWQAPLAGLLLAYGVLARPFDALVFGLPLLLHGLLRRRSSVDALLAFLPVLLAAVALLGINRHLTGDWSVFPSSAWMEEAFPDRPGCGRLGFGADAGCFPIDGTFGYTPMKAMKTLCRNLVVFDRLLLGLPGGGILACYGAFLWMRGGLSLERLHLLLLLPLVPLAYTLYWSPGVAYGPRFYHPILVVAPILVATALVRHLGWTRWIPAVLPPLVGLWLAARDLGNSYWCVDGRLGKALTAQGVGDAVVFVDSIGERNLGWAWLGVPDFRCNRALEIGNGFAWNGPESTHGWLFRFLPDDPRETVPFLRQIHPGADAWVWQHHQESDQVRLLHLVPGTPP